MARHQDQQRVGTRFQQAPVGCQDDLVLAGMGAGGDPQRSRRRVPFLAQGGSGQRQLRVDAQVELDRAGHADALRTRAETTEALGLGLGLHGDPGQLGEHRPGQPGEARVATRRALGQARIGQRHRDPAHGAGMDMVGPQLGFHDHRQARPHPVEEARRRPGQVVGQVAVPDLLAEQCADALRAGRGHAGDGDRQLRMALQQRPHHRRGGDALAHRDGVHPDAAGRHLGQRQGKTLADALGIGRCLARAPPQAQRHQRQAEVEQQGIEGTVHGRAA